MVVLYALCPWSGGLFSLFCYNSTLFWYKLKKETIKIHHFMTRLLRESENIHRHKEGEIPS